MKPTAKVCQIGTTNYVDYKGERLTVREHNKKYGTKIKIPKNVKVCEPEFSTMTNKGFVTVPSINSKQIVTEVTTKSGTGGYIKHGSRAKKEKVVDCSYCFFDETLHELHLRDIEVPKNLRRVKQDEMKEVSRQIEMGWSRGFDVGLVVGAGIMFVIALASIIIHSLQH